MSITIFEKNGYIGGRSTTVNVFDDPRYPVELGAHSKKMHGGLIVKERRFLSPQTGFLFKQQLTLDSIPVPCVKIATTTTLECISANNST